MLPEAYDTGDIPLEGFAVVGRRRIGLVEFTNGLVLHLLGVGLERLHRRNWDWVLFVKVDLTFQKRL